MADASGAPGPRRPTFDPTFNLGHVLTMAVIAIGILGSVMTLKDGLSEGLAEIRSENKVQDSRIDAAAKELARSQAEDSTFRSEVRQSLTQLTAAIADLRVKIVEAQQAVTAVPPPRR